MSNKQRNADSRTTSTTTTTPTTTSSSSCCNRNDDTTTTTATVENDEEDTVHCFVVGDEEAASAMFRHLLVTSCAAIDYNSDNNNNNNKVSLMHRQHHQHHPTSNQNQNQHLAYTVIKDKDKDGVAMDVELLGTSGDDGAQQRGVRGGGGGGGGGASVTTTTTTTTTPQRVLMHRKGGPGWLQAATLAGSSTPMGRLRLGVTVVATNANFAVNYLKNVQRLTTAVQQLWPPSREGPGKGGKPATMRRVGPDPYGVAVVAVGNSVDFGDETEAAFIALGFALCAHWVTLHNWRFMTGDFRSLLIDVSKKVGFRDQIQRRYLEFQRMCGSLITSESVGLSICDMPQTSARMLFQLLIPKNWRRDYYQCTLTTGAMALRTWVIAKNWAAVREVCLTDALQGAEVDLSHAKLDCIPESLLGLSCSTLQLTSNNLQGFPQWLPDSNFEQVSFEKNPLPYNPSYWDALMHFVKFEEKPVLIQFFKLLIMGESTAGKASLFKWITGTPLPKQTDPSKIATQSKSIKQRESSLVAWHLGEKKDWHPFYSCLFCSDSFFVLVFDSSSENALDKIVLWLNQLVRCQSQGRRRISHGDPQVALIGTYTEACETGSFVLKSIFDSIIAHPINKNLHLSHFFGINLQGGKGIHLKYETNSSWNLCMLDSPGKQISYELASGFWHLNRGFVSASWVALNKELRKMKEVSELSWNKFVSIARKCGVGKNLRTKQKQLIEIESCCDFLSDIGTLIHFRHPFFTHDTLSSSSSSLSSSHYYYVQCHQQLQDIIVLKLDWFSPILQAIKKLPVLNHTDCVMPVEALFTSGMCELCQHSDLIRVLPLLLKLQVMVSRLPQRLPDSPPPVEIGLFYGISKNHQDKVIISRRAIKCGKSFTPEAFSEVMVALWNLPSAEPRWFWREGCVIL